MLTISFRDNLNTKKFHRAMSDRVYSIQSYLQAIILSGTQAKRVIFLVHGYANSPEDVSKAYETISAKLLSYENLVIGIEWPSNGSLFGYYADRTDAKQAGIYLGRIINYLHQDTKIPMHIMSHSMGGRVVAESLGRMSSQNINTWVAFNADINPEKMKRRGEYGEYADAVKHAYLYHSHEDRVLGFIAPMALPVRRVGRVGVYEPVSPDNFHNVDAALLDKEKVRHGHYKESEVLIPHALGLMKGNE